MSKHEWGGERERERQRERKREREPHAAAMLSVQSLTRGLISRTHEIMT